MNHIDKRVIIATLRMVLFEEYISSHTQPTKVAQLVKANARMCGRGARSPVRILPLVKYPDLPNASYCKHGQHPEVWVPMKSPKGLAMEGSSVIKIYIYIYIGSYTHSLQLSDLF